MNSIKKHKIKLVLLILFSMLGVVVPVELIEQLLSLLP